MKKLFNQIVRPTIRRLGVDVVRHEDVPRDFTEDNARICAAVKAFTMTPPERVNALVDAVNYLEANKVPGAFVECGVWKGGSAMAMALALAQHERTDRALYLYDTYTGMTAPGEDDVSIGGEKAQTTFAEKQTGDDASDWCLSGVDEVRNNVLSTGYPAEKFQFIEGKVEDTIPGQVPEKIALLRLDTDWYESTKHEMEHLFPRLQPGGILIIDDYGHWRGSRKAVDEYLAQTGQHLLLVRVDYSCRMAVKTLSTA